jgi:hypothetical protein
MSRTPDQIVSAEVHYCVSYLVSTLAQGYGWPAANAHTGDLPDMIEQAMELCSPINDYEEAAIQAGWEDVTTNEFPPCTQFRDTTDDMRWACSGWQSLCEEFDIEPYEREVFEHWIVSDWLADKLIEKGEKVGKDFAGMTVWARTTSGQGIASDSVIEAIAADLAR